MERSEVQRPTYPILQWELVTRTRFRTEEDCYAFLFRQRWPEGFECPLCRGRGWQLGRRRLIECCRCHRQTSLTAGTIFHGTKKPLSLWFRAAFLLTDM